MIPFIEILVQADGSWLYSWEATDASFYRIVLDGVFVNWTESTEFQYYDPNYTETPAPLEIGEDNDPVLSEQFPCVIQLQWYNDDSVFAYNIEQYDSDAADWVLVGYMEQPDSWIVTWTSPPYEDGTDIQLRVIALDEIDNESIPLEYQTTIVSPPEPPTVVIGYTSGTTSITVSE